MSNQFNLEIQVTTGVPTTKIGELLGVTSKIIQVSAVSGQYVCINRCHELLWCHALFEHFGKISAHTDFQLSSRHLLRDPCMQPKAQLFCLKH